MPRIFGSRHGAGRDGAIPRAASSLVIASRSYRLPGAALADRHRVDQAAFGPQIVEPAIKFQRRAGADVAVEDLAVIADHLDRVVGPFFVVIAAEERFPHTWGDAQH